MAIHARGRGVMARGLPGIELRRHDVTVFARCRVFAEIRKTLGVVEGESSNSEEDSNQNSEWYRAVPEPTRIASIVHGNLFRHQHSIAYPRIPSDRPTSGHGLVASGCSSLLASHLSRMPHRCCATEIWLFVAGKSSPNSRERCRKETPMFQRATTSRRFGIESAAPARWTQTAEALHAILKHCSASAPLENSARK